jgi:hypothetical protein
MPPSTNSSKTASASCRPDCGLAFILLSILNARTLLGLLSQSSGAISNPVSAYILSTSNKYSSKMGVFSSDVFTEVVLVDSSDVTFVDVVVT